MTRAKHNNLPGAGGGSPPAGVWGNAPVPPRRSLPPAGTGRDDNRLQPTATDYNRWAGVALGLLLACLVGCGSVPFEPMPKSDLSCADPVAVRDNFQKTVPPKLKQLQSVTFQFFGKEMVGLGVLEVDIENKTFKLACSTLSGAKLFDLEGTAEKITVHNAAPAFGEYTQEISQAVGQDIRYIYFDWTPETIDKIKHGKYELKLIEKTDNGRIEYTFAGYDRQLVEKRVYRGWKRLSRVRYFDYTTGKQGIYPKGIVLKNGKFRYRLIIRVKQEL